MPIRPENRALYPKDWPEISLEVRERAGWRCEGSPAFPACRAANGGREKTAQDRLLRLQGERIIFVRDLAAEAGFKAWALGLTAKGWPRHPSRLPYGDGDNPSEGFGLRIELVKSAHFERFAPAIRLPEEGT